MKHLQLSMFDHHFDTFKINQNTNLPDPAWRRDWRKYDKPTLISELEALDWNFKSDLVQDYWNQLENQLIAVVDKIVPLTKVVNNSFVAAPTPSEGSFWGIL